MSLTEPPLATTVVAHIDLLGYGTMLRAASGQLSHPVGALACERIRAFHGVERLQRPPSGVTVKKLNDAIVAVRDLDRDPETGGIRQTLDSLRPLTLSARGAGEYWAFLEWTRDVHDDIRRSQRGAGYPGARTVVVADERLATPPDDDPLNLNMAFAAAYLADHAGSRAGLGGDYLYVEWRAYSLVLGILRRLFPIAPSIASDVDFLGSKLSFLRCIPKSSQPADGMPPSRTRDAVYVTDIAGSL